MPNKKKGEKKTQGGKEKSKPKTKVMMGGTIGLNVKPDKGNYYNVVTSLGKSACSPPCPAPSCKPCCTLPVCSPPPMCCYMPPSCVKQPSKRCC